MVTFVIGGMTGVLLAVPPADFVLHNSLFLVAHFHNVIIGGVLFGAFAGYTYWFPKAFGFRLHEGLGKAAFWCWLDRLLRRLHAALRARPDGHDAAHAALRRARVAALAAGRGGRRGCSSLIGIALPDRAARRQHPPPRGAARRDRRSVERPLARMGDAVAAAGVQLRGAAARRGRGRLLGHASSARIEQPGAARRARLRATSRCRATARPASSAPSSRPSWASR